MLSFEEKIGHGDFSQVRPPKISSAAESAQGLVSAGKFGPRRLRESACDWAAEMELASQLLGILSQHCGQVSCPTYCQKLGHVS